MKTIQQQTRALIQLEQLEDNNEASSILNDTFRVYDIDSTTYNQVTIRAVLTNSRKEHLYIVVNNNLLQIVKEGKYYDYEINGNSGKNTKFIKELNLPTSCNSTINLIHNNLI